METLLGIIVIGAALLLMAVGVIFNKKPLRGSCGGTGSKVIIDGKEVACPTCGGDTQKCENV